MLRPSSWMSVDVVRWLILLSRKKGISLGHDTEMFAPYS